MTDLRTAALRALKAWDTTPLLKAGDGMLQERMEDLRAYLAQPEDKSQAAFEHWVETVEATQGCAISRNAVADAGSIIKPEIKVDNAEPVAWINAANLQGLTLGLYGYAEIYTDESQGRIPLYTAPHRQWQTLSDEEIYGSFRKSGLEAYHQRDAVVQYDYDRRINAFARAVEEKLRAKNSTLACIPAVPPG
jgi:hypothetical protein